MSNVLRFLGGLGLLALASLTALPAPTHALWGMSVAATAWSYWLAIPAILPLIPMRDASWLGRLGAVLSVGAIALFLVPVLRAQHMNGDLPAIFNTRFGEDRRDRTGDPADSRPAPLVLPDLLNPLPLPPVRVDERTFRNREGLQLTLDIYR